MIAHLIIQTERRSPPRDTSVDTQGQLHTIGSFPENLDDPQFVMVATWDGSSPYVICHKGDYSTVTNRYAGWPEITKEQYDAPPADPV